MAEEATTRAGVGVVVVGDVPHVVVDVVLEREVLRHDIGEALVHVGELRGGRLGSVTPPHHHRGRADLALGDPADLVLVEPGRDPRRLAQVAVAPSVVRVVGVVVVAHHRAGMVQLPAHMKGLILSGGAGTRLRPITHTSAKQLVPIANKPILFYGLEDMVAAGITDIGIVVGDTHAEIEAAVGDGARFGAEITYIQQDAPLGLAHCVLIARDFLGDDDFVVYLGDNMLQQGLVQFVEQFERERGRAPQLGDEGARPPAAQILLAHVDDPRQFGVAAVDSAGNVLRLVEKPADPPSDLALAGVYLFDATIHEAVRAIKPSARGELEITDAIQWLIEHDHRVLHEVLQGWWIDTGKKDPLLDCNRLILETITPRIDGSVDAQSQVGGRVVIEAGAVLERSTVRGPAIIGANTRLVNAYVGPFTSIANDCEIIDAEIEHSVVLERSRIVGVHRIQDSLLGREVEVVRSQLRPQASRLMLGDHSRIELE
ncbi:MAG: glucose-phosphate thymidylyltransferase [Actinomycetota bacterium]|nr:glucose-phosphate thymidylyltransferase [Actinomycetota bacterium]